MLSSVAVKGIVLFLLVGNSISNQIHLTARQDNAGEFGNIPLCVVSAEGTLFTEVSGVLPSTGCIGATDATGNIDASVTEGVQPTSTISLFNAPTASTGPVQGPTSAAPLPLFITISATLSGLGETFSQTIFPDLITLTITETVTTGIIQTGASGWTTTIQGPIVVGPGGIGFVGQTGPLPTDVSIDGNGGNSGGNNNNPAGGGNNSGGDNNDPGADNNTPGGNNNTPGGGSSSSGGDNNNDNNDGNDKLSTQSEHSLSTTSTSTSTSSTDTCILTEVACTQTCTISSISGSSAPTTSCGSPGLCRRQAGGGGCTSTTATTTSTSFITASTSAWICEGGSCADTFCGSPAPNVVPAITTNAPGDQIPTLANLPNLEFKRRHRRISRVEKFVKRFANANDPTSIRQLDFTDPNSLYEPNDVDQSSKEQWYNNARILVGRDGPGNLVNTVGDGVAGFPSSATFNYADLRQNAITTGSGPSHGCTSVLVYSELGVWIAHFWEREQMQGDSKPILDFIRLGDTGRFEGLSDVITSIFSGPSPGEEEGEIVEVPVFSGAIIFTPSYREKSRNSADRPPGSQFTDPIYNDKVNQIKTLLVNLIPGFTLANMNQKITVAAYKPAESRAEIEFNPWSGLLTFEYVPHHVSNENNGCEVFRAIRIHIQDAIQTIMKWKWPDLPADHTADGPSQSKFKRQGTCPVNLPQILSAQGDGAAEPTSFFDVNTWVSIGTGVPSQGLVSPMTTTSSSSEPPPTTTAIVLAPSSTAAGPVLCSHWLLSLNGIQVGTDCDGDPKKTVTVTVAPGRRAIQTTF